MSNQVSSPKPTANVDPARQQLGAIYAKALLGASESAGQTDALIADLDAVVSQALDPHPQFEALLNSGLISVEEKERIIDRVLGARLAPLTVNFLKVLARRGRLNAIRDVHRAAHDLFNELRGRVRVEVVTATPLDSQSSQQLNDRIRDMLSREPVLVPRVDPHVIGGVVLRVGDTVYDNSVATQLQRLSGQIISRSVHEIQSRRDRFSYPAGN
jgi:F-type H+-transporting ATPase subunit delta